MSLWSGGRQMLSRRKRNTLKILTQDFWKMHVECIASLWPTRGDPLSGKAGEPHGVWGGRGGRGEHKCDDGYEASAQRHGWGQTEDSSGAPHDSGVPGLPWASQVLGCRGSRCSTGLSKSGFNPMRGGVGGWGRTKGVKNCPRKAAQVPWVGAPE